MTYQNCLIVSRLFLYCFTLPVESKCAWSSANTFWISLEALKYLVTHFVKHLSSLPRSCVVLSNSKTQRSKQLNEIWLNVLKNSRKVVLSSILSKSQKNKMDFCFKRPFFDEKFCFCLHSFRSIFSYQTFKSYNTWNKRLF